MTTLSMLTPRLAPLATGMAAALYLAAFSSTPATAQHVDRGTLLLEPERTRSLTAIELDELAKAGRVAELAGAASCSVDAYRIRYRTVGGAGESVTSSAAVLVPRGEALVCREPTSLVMYARGTEFVRKADMSELEVGMPDAVVAATFFAAQGYVVVAPNYVGYAASDAAYHPYYNLESQAQDVIDALSAANAGSASMGIQKAKKLFLAGYSQGGAVALATQRAIERSSGQIDLRVTATAASAGAYMLGEMGKTVFNGQPSVGATGFVPLLISSYQASGERIYSDLSDVYAPHFNKSGEHTRLPGALTYPQLLAQGALPRNLFDRGDGAPFLINERFRLAYNADENHPLRRALERNNLDDWRPAAPLMLCHGSKDALVSFGNTRSVLESFKAQGSVVSSVDLEDASMPLANAFRGALDRSSSPESRAALYHFVGMPFCQANARSFIAVHQAE